MFRFAFLSLLLLTVACVHADSARMGALGRNDTVIVKESDPVASDAIKAESAERKTADAALASSIESVHSLANGASAKANAAAESASKASVKADEASAKADSASVVAADAIVEAEAATAEASAAASTADEALDRADVANAKAEDAKVSATTAQATATNALTKAQEANATAQNALATAQTATATATKAASAESLSALSGRVADLEANATATPSSVAALQKRVSDVESSVATVQTTASNALNLASDASTASAQAQSVAAQAAADAASVKATADGAKATAQSAQSVASQALTKAEDATASASNAVATANQALAKAEAAGSSEKLTVLTDRVGKTESGLNTMNNAVQDLSASVSAEASARASADGAISARIDTLSTKASAAEASLSSLAVKAGNIEASVESISAAASAALQQANEATSTVASAISASNAATDAANLAKATANAAEATANDARTAANSAVTTVSEIEGRMDSVYKIAEEARVASTVVTDLAPDISKAVADANDASSKVLTFSSRVDKLSSDFSTLKTNVSQYRNDVSDYKSQSLPKLAVSDDYEEALYSGETKSELVYSGNDNTLTIRLGEGLKRESVYYKNYFQGYRLAADFSSITDTSWVHRNDWTLGVSPAESIISVSEVTNVSTNGYGQVFGESTVQRVESGARGVYMAFVDPDPTSSVSPTFTVSDGATLIKWSNQERSCLVTAGQEGLYRVTATAKNGVARDVFVPIRTRTTTSSGASVYVSDEGDTPRKAANDAMLAILQQRDRTATRVIGVTEAVESAGWYASISFTSWNWNNNGAMPKEFACFTYPQEAWGPPHTAVAPHYAITAEHWKPDAVRSLGLILKLDGTKVHNTTGATTIRGTSLAAWARQNGYTEKEIADANISDLYVWTLAQNSYSVFPDELIPHVMDQSAVDYYYNGSLAGIACYALTQDLYVSYSAYRSDYGDRWCLFGESYDPQYVRADILEQLTPSACSKIYGGDSGRPILFLHNGDTPVLTSIFWTVANGSSLVKGAEILDAFIKADSNGRESLKRISAPTE
jgi:hypothetical protein